MCIPSQKDQVLNKNAFNYISSNLKFQKPLRFLSQESMTEIIPIN